MKHQCLDVRIDILLSILARVHLVLDFAQQQYPLERGRVRREQIVQLVPG